MKMRRKTKICKQCKKEIFNKKGNAIYCDKCALMRRKKMQKRNYLKYKRRKHDTKL